MGIKDRGTESRAHWERSLGTCQGGWRDGTFLGSSARQIPSAFIQISSICRLENFEHHRCGDAAAVMCECVAAMVWTPGFKQQVIAFITAQVRLFAGSKYFQFLRGMSVELSLISFFCVCDCFDWAAHRTTVLEAFAAGMALTLAALAIIRVFITADCIVVHAKPIRDVQVVG